MQGRPKGGKNRYYSKEEKLKYVKQMLDGRSCWEIEREDGNEIENKFGYLKNAIISNINKLNTNIEDLWGEEELEDIYSSNMER